MGYKYVPLPRTCERCGRKGDTNDTQACILFKIENNPVVRSVDLKEWKVMCEACETEVKQIITDHMERLDISKKEVLSHEEIGTGRCESH